VHIHPMV
jgi:hypothetical protein